MGTTTVHTTAYRIVADTNDFQKGAALTRDQLKLQKRTLREIQSPLDKYESKQQELAKLVKQGAISVGQMNKALDRQAAKLGIVTKKATKTERAIDGIRKISGKAKMAIAGLGAGMTAAAVGGVAFLLNKTMELNKEIKDFERFGLQASSLGAFKVMARDAGLAVEDLVDLTKDLTIRIGEANIDGSGEIFDTFKRLGLNVRELKGLGPERQLEKFADAIAKVENETEKLAITDILLSDAGTKALGILNKGGEAMRAATGEAKRLGLALSTADEQVITRAARNIQEMQKTWDGFMQSLSVSVLPFVTKELRFWTYRIQELLGIEIKPEVGLTQAARDALARKEVGQAEIDRRREVNSMNALAEAGTRAVEQQRAQEQTQIAVEAMTEAAHSLLDYFQVRAPQPQQANAAYGGA